MPTHDIKPYREAVIAGVESVACGFGINGCEGGMTLESAWHIIADLESVFGAEEWASEFPNGFTLDQLTVDHLRRARLVSCHSCKHELEQAATVTSKPKPSFALLMSTVNERANGRKQAAERAERDEQQTRQRQALQALARIPLGGGNSIGKRHKPSARDVAHNNGHRTPVATT